MRIASNRIISLKSNEIFVYGDNLKHAHGKGAALTAVRKFGAVNGKGEHVGKSYGIPTKDRNMKTLSLQQISLHINRFIKYASQNPQLKFLVTEVGCGLAGYNPKDIAPLFEEAVNIGNIYLPASFWHILL